MDTPSTALLPPHQVRYLLAKLFARESDESMWPLVAGTTAASLAERYEEDYNRCMDVSRMIHEDMAKSKEKGPTPSLDIGP